MVTVDIQKRPTDTKESQCESVAYCRPASWPAALMLAPTAGAQTIDTAHANFGQHVSTCAQTMGFSGEHNLGTHQGAAGWNGMPCERRHDCWSPAERHTPSSRRPDGRR